MEPRSLLSMALPPGSQWLPRVIRGAQNRDDTAVADSLAYLNSLYGLALKLTRDPAAAEDLVQDTYLKAVRFWPQFQQGSNLKAWLFAILHNTFRNDRRTANRHPEDADSDAIDKLALETPEDDPERRLIRSTLDADLQAALDALPQVYREAVWLRDVEDCTYQEIADILAIPVGTVMSRIARGRRQLYAHLVAARRRSEDTATTSEADSGASDRSMSS